MAAYIHHTVDHLYVSSSKTNTIYDLFPRLDMIKENSILDEDGTTREESEILERDKVYEADRTLFEPYFRHVQNQ